MGTPFETPEIIFSIVELTNSPVVKQRLLRCHPKGCGSKKHDCDRLFIIDIGSFMYSQKNTLQKPTTHSYDGPVAQWALARNGINSFSSTNYLPYS